MTHSCCHHNCIEELKADHEKIMEAVANLEKSVNSSVINREGVAEFLHFTENFAEPHHQKEEQVLFPALEKKGIAKEGGPVGVMLLEHEAKRNYIKSLREALEAMKTTSSSLPSLTRAVAKSGEERMFSDSLRESSVKENAQNIISLLTAHISKENDILYPMAQQVLSEDEMAELGGQCEKLKTESH